MDKLAIVEAVLIQGYRAVSLTLITELDLDICVRVRSTDLLPGFLQVDHHTQP